VTFTGFSNGIEKDKTILILNKTASTMATAFSWIHLKWIIVVSAPIWNETYFKIKCVYFNSIPIEYCRDNKQD